ncbi:MAG TPA: hypothetical protein VHO02_01475 [Fibrobacteria bacterium]|nr:hypothetical protein [Fibrobacteria bacterium]
MDSFVPRFFPTALRRALPLFAAFFALAVPAVAQTYEFVGTVTDDVRGEAVGGAEIFTPDGRKLGTSQASGRFEVTVNNRRAKLIFKRDGFRELEVNLGDYANLVDVDILMESSVQELGEVTAYAPRRPLDPGQAQSIEELESLQGMRMDLNDHLRQMHGVAGMNEFTGDISVYGSRTRDVTHYLGRSRVPSLRHLEFGFPGNQSVLNPRLLKSVTLADNPAKGPVNQGNASALVYDLQDGDPENIRGDVVLGSTNRELNLSTYWGGRTNLFSARYLSPNALGALGRQFYTAPVDSRIPGGCPANEKCGVSDPLKFSALDVFFSTFKRDSSGAFTRHTLIVLEDNYEVLEDKATVADNPKAQKLVEGFQGAWLYSLESVSPKESGELEWGFSFLSRNYKDAYRDTTEPIFSSQPMPSEDAPRWYPNGGLPGNDVDYLLGNNRRLDRDFILTLQWTSLGKTFGATPSYGMELEHLTQTRHYLDFVPNGSGSRDSTIDRASNVLEHGINLANVTYRLRWNLGKARSVEGSIGAAVAHEDGTCEDCTYVPDSANGANIPGRPGWYSSGQRKGLLPVGPIASVRYTHPLGEDHSMYGEVALRQSTDIEPQGRNALAARMTPSVEAKLGGNGFLFEPLRYAWSGYARWYDNPALPDPEVYWNYDETREAKSALVKGVNLTLNYLPGHHLGAGVNASVIQGEYALSDGGTLPWESNRTLDLVTNMRILPRDDSLLSFIVTYGVQNDAPLYEYRGLWTWTDEPTGQGYATGERAIYRNSSNPSISRQRLDARINIDLKSRWRPVESVRFFFEATNIFANYNDGIGGWLGGRNERRRGWTRTDESGDLEPVVTRGLGLFMMFGVEGKLKI